MSIELVEALLYIGDAIKALADSAEGIRKELEEFNKCACSIDALGNTATHPTIVIKDN